MGQGCMSRFPLNLIFGSIEACNHLWPANLIEHVLEVVPSCLVVMFTLYSVCFPTCRL